MDAGSGVKQVDGEPGELETLASGKVVAKEDGYVYVFTSNESQQDVLFDNLSVYQSTGPILEETHYYPFGLTMAGISTIAPLKIANRYKFNGIELNHKEFSDGSGLDLYTAYYRSLDPQIGRWWQVDPRPTAMFSPYAAMGNNPALYTDFMGDTTIPVGDVRGNWHNFDAKDNDIGLNELHVIASRTYPLGYNPFYTGASFGPLGVKWVNGGMGGGGVIQTKIQSPFNLNNFDPTTTIKASHNVFISPGVKMEAFSTRKTHEGTSPIELIIALRTRKQISTSYHLATGTYNIGADGSFSYGNGFISFGSTSDNIWTLSLSFPTGKHTSTGTTIYYNPQNFINNLKWLREGLDKDLRFIYYTLPLSSPTAVPLAPAF